MDAKIPIALAEGDGIGPEITQAVLDILEAAKAPLQWHLCSIGEKEYLKGELTGISAKTWETIRQCKAFLKAPITTPQGGGFRSLNVTIRTTLGLYANVRPCTAYFPFVPTKHPLMDLVVIRENEEDLYTGIEYQPTSSVCCAIKMISREGSERIVRYAFEYARANSRKKVTCFTKDNILKLSDGLFHKIFREIALEYPDISHEHWIVDIGAAKLADTPEAFDVLVLPNLYGDILSDVAAQIAGSVGLAGSANIGLHGAMFEAIHGSAPRRAGQNMANPSGLLLGAILMLAHVGLPEMATLIHNAWLATIEDGIHTYDIFDPKVSKIKVGTREFAQAVIARLGEKPHTLRSAHYGAVLPHKEPPNQKTNSTQSLIGSDLFFAYKGTVASLITAIEKASIAPYTLEAIYNRGARVWPDGAPETLCIDWWRCRFLSPSATTTSTGKLLSALGDAGLTCTGVEQLYRYS